MDGDSETLKRLARNAVSKLGKGAAKRKSQFETPSVSRTKGNVLGSSPDFKSLRIDNQLESMNAIP